MSAHTHNWRGLNFYAYLRFSLQRSSLRTQTHINIIIRVTCRIIIFKLDMMLFVWKSSRPHFPCEMLRRCCPNITACLCILTFYIIIFFWFVYVYLVVCGCNNLMPKYINMIRLKEGGSAGKKCALRFGEKWTSLIFEILGMGSKDSAAKYAVT
jgi:hypothetical protein